MSNPQRGVFTVIGATAIASALILFNGNNEAEAEEKVPSAAVLLDSPDKRSDTTAKVPESSIIKKNTQATGHVLIPPPLGPFHFNVPALKNSAIQVNGSQVQAVSAGVKAAEFTKFQPTFPEVPNLKVTTPSAPVLKEIQRNAPVFSKVTPKQPEKVVSGIQQPKGVSQSQTAPINNHVLMQPPVFNATPPVQRYMYVPMPMYPHQPVPPKIYYNPQAFNNGSVNHSGNDNKAPKSEPIKSEVVQ